MVPNMHNESKGQAASYTSLVTVSDVSSWGGILGYKPSRIAVLWLRISTRKFELRTQWKETSFVMESCLESLGSFSIHGID
jgi:hypothetical protein